MSGDAGNVARQDTALLNEIDLEKYYEEYALDGMFALYDPKSKVCKIFNKKYFNQPATPASTFNITTSLIALEEGILQNRRSPVSFDEYHKSKYPDQNKNLELEFAFQRNIDWVFFNLRKQIGAERLQKWLNRLQFGNIIIPATLDSIKIANGKTDTFWVVPGTLQISPAQQLNYMQRLRTGTLPFSRQNIQEVIEMMYLTEINGYKVYGKQGSYLLETEGRYIGWLVGWIGKHDHPIFYVNFLQTPNLRHPSIAKAQKELSYKILENAGDYLGE
jgi:beta-lactamase class D